MRDIQSEKDGRNISIDKVGIKDITYPVTLEDKERGKQSSVAVIDMFVNLPHSFKGTHMSRFVQILNDYKDDISIGSVSKILDTMSERLDSDEAHIQLKFPYFIKRKAPVSEQSSMMDYRCRFEASVKCGVKDFVLHVKVPVLTVCPCSKEISLYGAHNQRSFVGISIRYNKMVWIEDLIEFAETSASSPIYPLLKREDEKFVTEKSYENPVFVEDVVRNVAEKLMNDNRIDWFKVTSENIESIHNHSAYAVIERDKR